MTDEALAAYAKKKKQRVLLRGILIAVLALAVLGTAGYFVLTRYLVAREVMVQGTDLYPKDKILEACAIPENAPLISLSKKEISRRVEESFPYLVDVAVEFTLPDTVNVTFREEFGRLALNLGAELFSVDEDLNVLAKESPDSAIPRIRLYTRDVSRCIVGEKLRFFEDSVGTGVLDVIGALRDAGMLDQVSVIDVCDKFNLKIRYLDRFELLIGEDSDLKYKFAMVKEVVKDLAPDETGRIDVSDPNAAYVKLTALI